MKMILIMYGKLNNFTSSQLMVQKDKRDHSSHLSDVINEKPKICEPNYSVI